MYYYQIGFLSLATKVLGLAILVYSYIVIFLNAISKLLVTHRPIDILITFVSAIIVLLFPTWLGLFLVKMFPAIQVETDGINCVSLSFMKDKIKWNEIESVLLFENYHIVIVFQRPGIFFLNGTYFNKLYGLLIRHWSTVLFLSPDTVNRDEILEAIYQNSNVKSIKKIRPRNI